MSDVVIPETLIAYCAGIIDADGTIGIVRRASRLQPGAATDGFIERVCVVQVTPEALDLLKALFGGGRHVDKPRASGACVGSGRATHYRPLHVWVATHLRAVACLRAVLPYLRIKRLQAENCLALHELKQHRRTGGRRSEELTEAMEFCKSVAKMLNAGGVRAESTQPMPLEAPQ